MYNVTLTYRYIIGVPSAKKVAVKADSAKDLRDPPPLSGFQLKYPKSPLNISETPPPPLLADFSDF